MVAITRTEDVAHAARRGRLLKPASRAASIAVMLLAGTAGLGAHDPGLSALDLRVEDREIVAVLSLSALDAPIVGSQEAVADAASESIRLAIDAVPLTLSTRSATTDLGGVRVRLTWNRASGTRLSVQSAIVSRVSPGHRQLLTVQTQDGVVLAQRMLDAMSRDAVVDLSTVTDDARASASRFFALGIRHILTGYDHLLFLAGVLVVLRRWRDILQTITAFTLAHSVTLALAIIGILRVPSHIVEPVIAASIVYVGVENLFRADGQRSRWKLTFGFGLIHGLGFATALRDLGVGTTGGPAIALPLASFNGGVEAGQLAVAALLVPLFWGFDARQVARGQFAQAWSLFVVAAGGYWLVERIL